MKKENGKNSVTNSKKVDDTIKAYTKGRSPLGSYSGLTDAIPVMPRKRIDGKVFMHIEDKPVQDADDL